MKTALKKQADGKINALTLAALLSIFIRDGWWGELWSNVWTIGLIHIFFYLLWIAVRFINKGGE